MFNYKDTSSNEQINFILVQGYDYKLAITVAISSLNYDVKYIEPDTFHIFNDKLYLYKS